MIGQIFSTIHDVGWLAAVKSCGQHWLGSMWPLTWTMVKIMCIVMPVMGLMAFLTLWERKVVGWMHVRLGPNRVGPAGLLQPVADGLKLLFKEVIIPEKADKIIYLLGPVLVLAPALAAWAVIPFGPEVVLADLNAGLLYIMAILSVCIYGVIAAGWASNSKYAFLGALRAAAVMVSFGIAMGFVLVIVLMVSGSLNLVDIVNGQNSGWFRDRGLNFLSWNWLPLLPMFVVYIICAIAETGRLPFDVIEGESEIVGGHMVEYSGMAFAMFFMAEYANMILLSTTASVLFLGGWLAPIGGLGWIPGWIWLVLKSFFLVSVFIWIRATFPRYRYDQIMRLGWKIFIPLTLVYLVVIAVWMQTPWNIWR